MSEAITKAIEALEAAHDLSLDGDHYAARVVMKEGAAELRAALSQAGQGGQGEVADHLFAAFGDGPTDEQCKDLWFRYPSLREWHKRTYAAQPAPVPAPVASVAGLPPTNFTEVAPGVEVGFDLLGGADIRLGGEFVYVHINYDHRYTHNAARHDLAMRIAQMLSPPTPSTQQSAPAVPADAYAALDHCVRVLEKVHADIMINDGMPGVGLLTALKNARALLSAAPKPDKEGG